MNDKRFVKPPKKPINDSDEMGNKMKLIHQDKLTVRKLTEEDAFLLVKWLSDPVVLEYYEGRDRAHDFELVRKHYYEDRDTITQCIVQHEDQDIGYIQFYPISDEERELYGYGNLNESIYGLDQFIGETEYWNRGIGTLLINKVTQYLFEQGVKIIVMDPQAQNHRALRCYEKCGFVRKMLLLKHEWHEGELRDCWLLEYTKK